MTDGYGDCDLCDAPVGLIVERMLDVGDGVIPVAVCYECRRRVRGGGQ
ncbi:hypothetical protein [Halostella litorea]|nr:hypothetical protein [Halostella litorea]